jgi:hypothetical protein
MLSHPLLSHPQFSPITPIKLFKCLVTIGLMVKSLNGFLPLLQLN